VSRLVLLHESRHPRAWLIFNVRQKMSEERLILYFMPSLVATLLNRECAKGAPLTEEEVLAIRGAAPCVATPVDVAAKVDQERGYTDIDAENCWAEWQAIREDLHRSAAQDEKKA